MRASCQPQIADTDWALLPPGPQAAEITQDGESLSLRNGNITATLNQRGQLAFRNQRGELLLEEFWRQRTTVGIGATEKSR